MKRSLILLVFACFSFTHIAKAQSPLFPTESSFAVYQPPIPPNTCSNCGYFPTLTTTGDFNGDGIVDLAYIDIGSQSPLDNFLVVAFGQSNGTPNQVATDLGTCKAGGRWPTHRPCHPSAFRK